MPLFQSVDGKLTMTQVAPASVLIPEIAKMTGQRLEVSKPLASEVLMVSVENVGVGEVLAKLALAASARWQPSESGYRLVPDNAARNIEASAERARRLQRLNQGLKNKQAAQAKRKAAMKGGEEGEEAEALASTFLGGGVDEFVPLLDLSTIANMEAGDRVVFASRPNGAQIRLNGDPGPIVAAWVAAHNKSAALMGHGLDDMGDEFEGIMQGPIGDRMRRMTEPVKGTPVKVVVVATKGGNPLLSGLMPGVRLEARAYGADGSVLLEEQGTLDTDMLTFFSRIGQPKAPVATKRTPIEYSEEAKALIASTGRRSSFMAGDFSTGSSLPASLKKRLFAPNRYEPLALVPGEGLAALARARRMPLVACVPDDAYPNGIRDEAPETVEDVAEALKGAESMRLIPDSTFLVVRPAEPEAARRNRLDRDALAQLMATVETNEIPGIDALSSFALASPAPDRNPIVQAFLTQFVPTAMFTLSGAPTWDGLRLFATLSTDQRASLAAGAKIPFSTLNNAGQAALMGLLYGSQSTLIVDRGGKAAEPDPFSAMMRMSMGGGVDARDEPTEIAPNGLPAAGYLQAAVEDDAIVRPTGTSGPVYYTLGTDELALFRMLDGTSGAMSGQVQLPSAGRVGTRSLWRIRGYVGPTAYVLSSLADDRVASDAPQVSLAALPADLSAKIDAKVEKLKKSPLGAMMSIGSKQP